MSSQEYEKDRTVQHKNNKSKLPKIASPAKMNTSEAELSDDTSPTEKEEGVNDIKDDKNKKNDKYKEPKCPDDTSTVDMEEGVIYRKYNSKENIIREKSQNALMTLPLLKLRKV